MVIHSLNLVDFRNYEKIDVEFHSGINFVFGKNGQGKTNLIESLYLITHLKSFRTPKISELTTFSKKASTIRTRLSKQGVHHEIRIGLQDNLKKVLHNGKTVSYTSDYIKDFLSLLFSPDQLAAYKEFPLERRNFIDRILFLIDPDYSHKIKEFNRVKQQKNALLRNGNQNELRVWNRLMAAVVPDIQIAREKITEQINRKITGIFGKLTGRQSNLVFNYEASLKKRGGSTQDSILALLEQKKEKEINQGHSIYGPHRDNYWMTLDEKPDRQAFSQGEYRVAYLSLQLAVDAIVTDLLGFKPILLLDDVFSELDDLVCEKTVNFINRKSNQVFITSTSIPEKFLEIGSHMHVENGSLPNN